MKTFDEIRGLCNEGTVNEISKDMKGRYIKKAADDMAKSADRLARADRNTDPKTVGRASRNFVNRRKGIAKAVEGNLYEMEMLTHKKKIAAAQAKFDAARAAHHKARDAHNDLAKKHGTAYIKAMKAKGHPRKGLIANPPAEAHDNADYKKYAAHSHYFDLHSRASEGNFRASHTLAKGVSGHFEHVPKKLDNHAIKCHNNMVDAHHALQAAKKASPLHKAKSAVHKFAKKIGRKIGVTEANLDEISNKKLAQYKQKAGDQYQKSRDYLDGPKFPVQRQNPAAVKRHTDRLKRRHKGIGSVIKRDMAGPDQKYITRPSMGDRIKQGAKGDSMTTKRADQLHKSYKTRKEDATDDAVKAFLKKGGKIKKLAPGKAAGYHGKDDPGSDVHGMMDRGDTKGMPRKKKIKSMGASPRGKREGVEEKFNFRVNVDGFPEMFMSGNSPGEVKTALRKLVKQPSMIKSVDRMTKHDLKKTRRKQAQVGESKDKTKVNELSKDTLQSYHKKSQDHMTTALKTNDPEMKKKFGKRLSGSGRAYQRLKKMGEEYKYDYGTPESVKLMKKMTPGQNENRRDRLRAKLAAVGKDMKKTNDGIKKAAGIEDKPKQRLGSDGKPFKPSIFKS